jgi:2,3-bisphosphoglycerate-independent phosphoglycerate mutase
MDATARPDAAGASAASSTAGPSHAETRAAAVRAAYERRGDGRVRRRDTVGGEARIRPGDSVLAFNFRPDRMRQSPELAEWSSATRR